MIKTETRNGKKIEIYVTPGDLRHCAEYNVALYKKAGSRVHKTLTYKSLSLAEKRAEEFLAS
jgi:hypothetical protein